VVDVVLILPPVSREALGDVPQEEGGQVVESAVLERLMLKVVGLEVRL